MFDQTLSADGDPKLGAYAISLEHLSCVTLLLIVHLHVAHENAHIGFTFRQFLGEVLDSS